MSTWKYQVQNYETLVLERLLQKKPVVLAHWHEDEWSLIGFFRNKGMNVLVSQSQDGSAMTRFLTWMGYVVARGSSSRGAVRGLVEFIRNIATSKLPLLSVAVDGPKGPRRIPKEGIFFIASKLKAPVLGMAAHASSAWHFRKSWSQAYVPKPFAKIDIYFTEMDSLNKTSTQNLASLGLGTLLTDRQNLKSHLKNGQRSDSQVELSKNERNEFDSPGTKYFEESKHLALILNSAKSMAKEMMISTHQAS